MFHRDEIATKMYFINSGVCEVQAIESHMPLKFLTKGGYFGEIGVLLTGKRTCSVVVRTTTILQAIKKEALEEILKAFPINSKFLYAVAKQREQTTRIEDVPNYDENRLIVELLNVLPQDENVFGSFAE
jgi:CRP-like cAMP-binding protein